MKKLLSATLLATSLLVAGGSLHGPGLCRGGLQPRQLRRSGIARSAQDLDRLRSAYPARPVRGPRHAGCQGRPHSRRRRELDGVGRRHGLHLQAARRTRCGRTATRSPPRTSSIPSAGCEDPATAAEYASMLYVVKNAEEINNGKMKPEELGVKAIDAKTLEVTLNAPTPYFLEMLTHQVDLSGAQGLDREARRRLDQARQSRFQRRLTRSPSSCRTITSSWSRTRSSMTPPTSRSTSSTTSRPRTARRRSSASRRASSTPTTTCRPSSSPISRPSSATRSASAPISAPTTTPSRPTRSRGTTSKLRHAISMAIDRDFLAEKVWQNTHDPGLFAWCRPASRATTPAIADYADMSQIDREDEAKKILDEARLWPGQAAEDGNPLQHVGEPQEHGGRHPGAAEAARHRSDAAQHRHQDPLRPSRAEGRLRRRPRRLDRRLQGSGNLPRHLAQGRAATTTRTTTARNSRS